MLERRTLLAGLAALPAAALPIAASAAADPFARYGAEVLALHESMGGLDDEAACTPMMARWAEIDRLALAGQPTTLAGALGALEYARREFHQFHVEVLEDVGGEVGQGDRLILHLIDGAVAVLRRTIGGGVA